MATFTYTPVYSVNETKKPRVKVAQFGDGYMQRVADGINTTPRTWSLTFRGTQSEIETIDAFLATANGVDSFDWTPPSGSAGKFLAMEWSVSAANYNDWSLSTTFTEVYGE